MSLLGTPPKTEITPSQPREESRYGCFGASGFSQWIDLEGIIPAIPASGISTRWASLVGSQLHIWFLQSRERARFLLGPIEFRLPTRYSSVQCVQKFQVKPFKINRAVLRKVRIGRACGQWSSHTHLYTASAANTENSQRKKSEWVKVQGQTTYRP